jgi:signal peptidase I
MTTNTSQTCNWQKIKENAQTIGIALILALIIRLFIAEPRYIPSESMLPTLDLGDRLIVEKVSYHFASPHPGDIVVFHPPTKLQALGYEPEQAFIKRVIATEGQIVAVTNGKVYIDQRPLAENYILESPEYQLLPLEVPSEHIFVMGDNRNNSNDSHVWGSLPETEIIGRAMFRFWPFNRLGLL